MKKVILTNQTILTLNAWANTFVIHKPTRYLKRLEYALKRTGESIKKQVQQLQEQLEDINLNHAFVNAETKELQTDEKGNYKYTIEGERARRKETRELLAKEVEVEIYTLEYSEEMKTVSGGDALLGNLIQGYTMVTEISEEQFLAKELAETA